MRILKIDQPQQIKQIMKEIQVDPYGIKIMLPKATSYLIRMNSISNIAANILKQEMLALGGDVAIARGALTGRIKNTDCLLMANFAQLMRLKDKLNKQPFGLNKLSEDISVTLSNYNKDKFLLDLPRYKINLSSKPRIMGILNLTPDSFSGDGLHGKFEVSEIVDYAQNLINCGADILDIGGESSRPQAKPVPLKEELSRTIPVIKSLSKKIKIPISIDTYKPEVARSALDCGASIVNDITGLRDKRMVKVVSKYKSGVVIMHMKGTPKNMQRNSTYKNLIDEIIGSLHKAIIFAQDSGVSSNKIIVDPGIGFGKTVEHNLEILKRLDEFKILGRPILVGTSRKSFIGKILNVGPQERLCGTLSTAVLAAKNGAKILRVHDVKEVKQALKLLEVTEKI